MHVTVEWLAARHRFSLEQGISPASMVCCHTLEIKLLVLQQGQKEKKIVLRLRNPTRLCETLYRVCEN